MPAQRHRFVSVARRRVPRTQFLLVLTRDNGQLQVAHRCDCRHAPQHVAQLLGQPLAIEFATLVEMLANVRQDLAGLLGDACRGVEEFSLIVESRVDRPCGGAEIQQR